MSGSAGREALHGLLLGTAERHADKAAFVGRDGATSYGELCRRAAAFAATLRELGVARGDRVAILFDGDVDYLVAFYGALMAGAAAVPLCPDTRTDPLVYALSHAEASAVALDAGNLRWLEGQRQRLPGLRAVLARGALPPHFDFPLVPHEQALANAGQRDDRAPGGDALAAIVYTSGTTGRPKGVMLSHQNLVANVRSIVSYLELTASDTAGMVLPFYYVYGNSVLHTHLAVGATIAQLGSLTFVAQVLENLAHFACTGLSGVPATFARLTSFAGLAKYDLSRLRYVTQAGAAMAPALIEKLARALPRAKLFVMYGQTEAAARLAYLPPERLRDKLGSAGKAIPGVTLKVCDPEGGELPRGTLGEVVAQGDNVMLGYWRDPEATERALTAAGLRTGDLGTMDEEGYLFLHGRESELIKSGGHRISPHEVEAAIAKLPSVREVAVCGVPDELLGDAIVAYVATVEGARPSKREVLDACFLSLPKFKMPTQIWIVDDLPRGATGKLLRKELRSWHSQQRGEKL